LINQVYVKTDVDIARKLNDASTESKMKESLFEDYVGRLEIPKTKGVNRCSDRWDNPMFVVEFDEELPCEEIANALFDGKKPKAPVSTKPVINKL
jgi:tRNA uridine 5-carbamoylmethylation protein Kti12